VKTLPSNLVTAKNLINQAGGWILLVQMTLPDDAGTVLRYARDTQDVEYGGNTYTRFNFDVSLVENSQRDQLSEVSLNVSNISQVLCAYLTDPDDVIGAAVVLTFVHTENLTESHAALAVNFTVKNYAMGPDTVEFTLGGANLAMQRFPLNEFIAMQCRHVLGDALCQYAGAVTTCDGKLSTCRTLSNSQHFGGFPGLISNNLVVAVWNG